MGRIFSVPGKPLGKQRPRVLKSGVTYTPKETINYETFVKQLYWEQYHREKPFQGPVKMSIKAYFPIPKSSSKKEKKLMWLGLRRPTKKPDIDNIIKIISDALNGLAYDDDKQIVSCTVEKFYSEVPRVEIELEEVPVWRDEENVEKA